MENRELAKKCVELAGGPDNIKSVSHCATRLRFVLVNQKAANIKGIEDLPDVLQVMTAGTQTQIVIGPEVPGVYNEACKLLEGKAEKGGQVEENGEKPSLSARFFTACSSIFSPLVPAFTAAGMVKAVLAILVAVGLSKDSQEYVIINYISDTVFYYLPILLAVTSASYYGCNRIMAAAISAMFVYPTYVSLVSAGEPVRFFGLPVTLYNYTSTAVPAILTTWFMSYVERFANRVSPKVVKAIMSPLITMAITAPIGLIIIGPIGAVLGDILMHGVQFLDENIPFLVATIMGAFNPLLVFVGMHRAVGTLGTMQLGSLGYESITGPGMLASNIAQGAATLVVSLKTRSEKVKSLAFTAGVTALCGITEPVLYGFSFKYKKELICAMIGGGVGGFYAGCTKLVRFAKGAPGLTTLPVYIDLENPANFTHALITCAIAFVVTFVLAWIIIKPEDVTDK